MTVEDAQMLPKAVRPINLPRIVLITGGINTKELATALAVFNQEFAVTYLRPSIEDLTVGFGLEGDEQPAPDKTVADYHKELMAFMDSRLGGDIHAMNFIRQEKKGWVEDDHFIFHDAEHWDVKPFCDNYGTANVLVLVTGQLKSPLHDCTTLWLPAPSLSERIGLLRRELGEL